MDHSDDSELPIPFQKRIVVGIYGVSGSGKTTQLKQLEEEFKEDPFRIKLYESSTVLDSLVPGGLEVFKKMDDQEKEVHREIAVRHVAKQCATLQEVGVVIGHFSFWENGAPNAVWTPADAQTYTHIVYFDVPAQIVAERRQNDSTRARQSLSPEQLETWQSFERRQLRAACLENGILFSVANPSRISSLLHDIGSHSEASNSTQATTRLDSLFRNESFGSKSSTVFVLDGDKTMIADDTGAFFVQSLLNGTTARDPLRSVFESPMGYSYAAFRQAALFYDDLDDVTFAQCCEHAVNSVTIHPEIVSLLQRAREERVPSLVITCGLQMVWQRILANAGLSDSVKVIGGGRIANGVVVTAEVKRLLVARLRDVHGKYVCALGDSVLDLPMLKEADRALIVVGDEGKRSISMENAVSIAINDKSLYACQVLLPPQVPPRLDTIRLPIAVDITSDQFWSSITAPILVATKGAANLLMTPMRDARLRGPALREAHVRVGRYLATQLLSECIGLEEFDIPHVQGHNTTGHRYSDEAKTVIVALMRGGEPMALGVNEAMPLAMFVHAKDSRDLTSHHIAGKKRVILVDSVVNSGQSVVEFVQRVRELDAAIHIVVVAGVVQAKAVSKNALGQILTSDMNIDLVALRQSDNKFTGRGGTDTGNRLFNTTHLA
ncbi:uracil phosphoribosyltransferase-domain-containing protein [Mycena amicta]|nr:uracil phosphoribosyltransferase-domain-containing protein [Mycena amicta]